MMMFDQLVDGEFMVFQDQTRERKLTSSPDYKKNKNLRNHLYCFEDKSIKKEEDKEKNLKKKSSIVLFRRKLKMKQHFLSHFFVTFLFNYFLICFLPLQVPNKALDLIILYQCAVFLFPLHPIYHQSLISVFVDTNSYACIVNDAKLRYFSICSLKPRGCFYEFHCFLCPV